jgi:hypothetical protein
MPTAATIRKAIFAAVVLLWSASVFYGARVLLRYETGPGEPGRPPSSWPRNTRLARTTGKFTLVMLAHPDCPCTRAGMKELEQLMARLRGRVNTFVVFRKPEQRQDEAESSALWRTAAAIPGVTVSHDTAGEETRRFGARVSGQAMLYNPEGELVFSGGLTNGRGREGYSRGEDLILQLVNGAGKGPAEAPVFGCSLYDPDENQLIEESSWKKR